MTFTNSNIDGQFEKGKDLIHNPQLLLLLNPFWKSLLVQLILTLLLLLHVTLDNMLESTFSISFDSHNINWTFYCQKPFLMSALPPPNSFSCTLTFILSRLIAFAFCYFKLSMPYLSFDSKSWKPMNITDIIMNMKTTLQNKGTWFPGIFLSLQMQY